MSSNLQSPDVAECWKDWLSDLFGIAAVVFVLVFLFSGCGGGTSGTGIRSGSQVVEGLVRTTEGSPIPGVVVTILETNDQAVTDSAGEFQIPVDESLDDFTVNFEGQGVDSDVAIGGVPEDTASVGVSVVIDDQTGELSETSVEIIAEDPVPTETPAATPSPTAMPIDSSDLPSPDQIL